MPKEKTEKEGAEKNTEATEKAKTPEEPTKEAMKDKGLTQEEVADIAKAAEKSEKEQVNEMIRYPGLKVVSHFSKTVGVILLAVFVILAFVQLFAAEGAGQKILYFFGCLVMGGLLWLFGYLLGDFFQILIDIEENTRKSKKKEK